MGKPLRRDGRYYTRRRVPQDLIAAYCGKKEVVVALGTADPAEGRRLHAKMWVQFDEEFAARRRELAQTQGADVQSEARAAAFRHAPLDLRIAAAVERLRKSRTASADASSLEEWTHLRRLDLAMHQAALDGHGDDLELSPQQHEVRRNALRAVLEGDTAAAFASTTAHHSLTNAIPIADLIERWAAAQEPTDKTLRKAKSVMNEVEGVHGSAMTTAHLTPHLAQSYKDVLIASGVKLVTGNNKLGLFRALCRFARENRLIVGDPCDGINITPSKRKRAADRRVAYTVDALNAILASPVYSDDQRPLGGSGEAAYWLPVLGLFTGARQRELGQLRVKDITQETYQDAKGGDATAWVINLVFDAGDGVRLKNEGSERRIPIHQSLIDLGFLRFVEAARQAKQHRLFPDLKPDRDGNVVAAWSKWYGRWQRKQCGITDRRMVFHSFRHAFKHFARYSGIEREVHHEITGHESGDVGDAYGGLSYPLLPLVEGMKTYRVPGLALPSPPPGFRLP